MIPDGQRTDPGTDALVTAMPHHPAQVGLIHGLNGDLPTGGGRGNGRQTPLRAPGTYIDAFKRAARGAQRFLQGMNAVKDFGR